MKVLLVYLIITVTGAAGQYYGTEIGAFTELFHAVSGSAYIMNDKEIFIKNFNYDGTGPAAFFYVGYSGTGPTAANFGVKFPDEKGNTATRLGRYVNKDLKLTVPDGIQLSNIRWISVWCDEFSVNFGHVTLRSGLVIPAPRNIGQFSRLAHRVSSGDVTIINHKQLEIKQFNYDGNGPDAFFLVGKGSVKGTDTKVPDHKGRLLQRERYNGVDIKLTLPDGVTVFDIDYVSLYCITYTQNFGQVNIPQGLAVPPYIEISADDSSDLENCEEMSDDFNVAWTINTTHIVLDLISTIGDRRYMAFGLSGSTSRSAMIGADVIVARYDVQPVATDYYLEAYAQCSNGRGACPDTEAGGRQDIQVIAGSRTNGVVKVRVVRPLQTADSNTGSGGTDRTYSQNQEQFIVWALGGLNPENLVTKHDRRLTGNKRIDFGRSTPEYNCRDLMKETDVDTGPKWTEQFIFGDSNQNVFTVRLGPTGGDKGYKAITGQQSWGIAYYINGNLIPHLVLTRGVTYTFIIESGKTPENTAEYHPFYITDDPRGGYTKLSPTERQSYQYFLGIEADGNPTPAGIGRFCEYKLRDPTSDALETSNTFEEYKQHLQVECKPGQRGELTFTPDQNTPDKLFYQCYTHFRLGWKIDIVDGEAPVTSTTSSTSTKRVTSTETVTSLASPATVPSLMMIMTFLLTLFLKLV